MKSKKQSAIELARRGFYVFQIVENGKTPQKSGWQESASNNPKIVEAMWNKNPECNIGIYTGLYKTDQALVVIDVDKKNNKDGFKSLSLLEEEGVLLPTTLTQETPSGGNHMIFSYANFLVSVRQEPAHLDIQ